MKKIKMKINKILKYISAQLNNKKIDNSEHRWKEIYHWQEYTFLGERLKEKYHTLSYRICRICGKIQQFSYLKCGSWEDFNDDEKMKILKRKIVDYGEYYMIND